MKSITTLAVAVSLFAFFGSGNAIAERADKDKPVTLEADKVTVDDRQQLHSYEGNVILTQGTLLIRSGKIQVRQDAQGYQRGIALSGPGGLASFRQKREGRDDYVEGEAERIEHDTRTDRTEFFGRARVKSGNDEVTGQYVLYDSRTENYVVTGGSGAAQPGGPGERVRVTIQPRKSGPEKPDSVLIPSKEQKQ